ncbi:hypothetical protein DFH29DRAFT_1065072 [Suillus ampliporus]|nr:hypothetical protein DFH29DRAFT_1065072 [Suillus ampliporus]
MSTVTWTCMSCPKTFARRGDMTRHQQLHTGIKPHVCETCGKGFAQYSGLKTHRNTHTKAKPYACGIGTCTKAFSDPSSCTRHRKETHRREGAYKCVVPECGTRIKRRSAFVAHLKKHGIDPRTLDLNAIAKSADKNNSQQSDFHFLPPFVSDAPYCPPSEADTTNAVDNIPPPGVTDNDLAHWNSPAPMPTSNYQTPVASGVADGMYDYNWASVLDAGPSTSSSMPAPSASTYLPIDDFIFHAGYDGYLQPNVMLPSPYASASPSLPPLLDGFIDPLGPPIRSLSSSPATSSSSALDDHLDHALLSDHNVPTPYLLFNAA